MSLKSKGRVDLRSVRLRPATEDDDPFFFELFSQDRAPEFSALGLSAAELRPLLTMQFDAQRSGYRAQFPTSRPSVVLLDDFQIGRLWIDWSPVEIRLLDILLAPEYRNAGIGAMLVREVLSEAAREGRPVRLMVALTNGAAIRFYDRLGFVAVQDEGLYRLMERCPTSG